ETSSAESAAAIAWALAGEEQARLRLLARPQVCEALVERLSTLFAESSARERTLGEIGAAWRSGLRREALRQARAWLAEHADSTIAEIAAIVVALAVRGPRLDIWIDHSEARPPVPETAGARLLAAERLAIVLGERVTMGRRGASVAITGPGV